MYNLSEIPSKNKISGIKHECKNDCGDEYYNIILPKYWTTV